MKAQTHYTTPITATPWMRRGMWVLAALFVLAVIVGLVYALGLFRQPSQSGTNAGVGATARPLVTYCRVCQDEVLAARQPWQPRLEPTPLPRSIASPARSLIDTCRVCRDEVLGGSQTSLITPAYEEPLLQTSDPRQRGPR